MDSTDKPRSKIPVAVKIASEAEPVACDGHFVEQDNGFVLEFGTPSARYEITHSEKNTRLSASGLLSYVLDFSEGGATEVVTPLGGIDFSLTPVNREVVLEANGVKLNLEYKLVGAGVETLRAVKVDARFLR